MAPEELGKARFFGEPGRVFYDIFGDTFGPFLTLAEAKDDAEAAESDYLASLMAANKGK